MKITFAIPETPMVRVIYNRDGTQYGGVIPNPKDTDGLVSSMLSRQVGVSQIVRIEPVQPRQELHHGHPAQHRLAQYMSSESGYTLIEAVVGGIVAMALGIGIIFAVIAIHFLLKLW
jgi:hypothetical protein